MSMVDFQGGPARLRWLLIAIILLAVLPVFALYLARLNSSSERALAEARSQAEALARSGAAAQSALVANARGLLETLRNIPAIRDATADCDATSRQINERYTWISSVFLLDLEGRGVCGSQPTTRSVNMHDRSYFRDALVSDEFAVSDALIGRITKRPVVGAALPVFAPSGAKTGILVVGVDLIWLPEIASIARQKYDGIVFAINRNGGLISRVAGKDDAPEISETEVRNRETVRDLVEADTPTIEITDSAGVERIFGIAHLKEFGLTIAVGLKRADVLDPIIRQFWLDLFLLLAVAAGSVGAALVLAETFVLGGVRALKAASQKLKAGKMGVRVVLPTHVATELHDLAATYNSMTAEFERLAYLDRLTGLPNRRYLERQMLARNERENGDPLREAVLAVDLDGFKPVNDAYGHAMGDRVLTAVARRIAAVADGRAALARLGGDEFVAVLPLSNGDGREEARRFGEELRAALDEAVEIEGSLFPVGASVGIALVPGDADTLAGGLIAADAALYEAKRAGRNRVIDHAPPLAAEPGADDDFHEGHWTGLDLVGWSENHYFPKRYRN